MEEQTKKGVKYMILASFLFAIMGAFAKELSNSMSSIEIVFFRNVFGVFIIGYSIYKRPLKQVGGKPFLLMFRGLIGFIALSTGKTGEILTISCFGALGLYIISMFSFFALRKNEPNLERPFKVPFYPIFPAMALIVSSICMVALIIFNKDLFFIFAEVLLIAYIPYLIMKKTEMKTIAIYVVAFIIFLVPIGINWSVDSQLSGLQKDYEATTELIAEPKENTNVEEEKTKLQTIIKTHNELLIEFNSNTWQEWFVNTGTEPLN